MLATFFNFPSKTSNSRACPALLLEYRVPQMAGHPGDQRDKPSVQVSWHGTGCLWRSSSSSSIRDIIHAVILLSLPLWSALTRKVLRWRLSRWLSGFLILPAPDGGMQCLIVTPRPLQWPLFSLSRSPAVTLNHGLFFPIMVSNALMINRAIICNQCHNLVSLWIRWWAIPLETLACFLGRFKSVLLLVVQVFNIRRLSGLSDLDYSSWNGLNDTGTSYFLISLLVIGLHS